MMNKEYWDSYYEHIGGNIFDPSRFAEFVLKYINHDEIVLDIGCGNGRDSIFFACNGIKTIAVDQSEIAIKNLNEKRIEDLKAYVLDLKNLKSLDETINHAYCRFVLHAIPMEIENCVIEWVKNNIGGYFFIEVRSDKDELFNKPASHYRNFHNFTEFVEKLIKSGFDLVYAEESRGFSPYFEGYNIHENEKDPVIIRIIVKSRMW